MRFIFPFTIIFMFLVSGVFAQNADTVHADTHHGHHHHEIGVANSLVYFINEKEIGYGLHLHYSYIIPSSRFGIGLAYERIFDEHKHNTFGIVGIYRPTDALNIALTPGIAFAKHDGWSSSFAIHAEVSYEFEIHDFHLGPSLEFAYEPEELHISLGLHLGLGF